MRRLFIAFLFFCLSVLGVNAQNKHALLIGVSKYPANSGWKNLSSDKDIIYIREALRLQGFMESNIMTLADEQATRQGMVDAMAAFALRLKAGDIVYFHFSGHGQQIYDDEENLDEADGYDEALVPYDAQSSFNPRKYRGENHFRDDALGAWLETVRRMIGETGSLLVVIDACHSGTATRSGEFAVVRGDPTPFLKPGYTPKPRIIPGARSTQGEGFFSASPLATANMVVFSASSPHQVNYETRDANQQWVGSLSYAVSQVLLQMGKGFSYADLFDRVKARIQADYPQQIPMLEGNALQRVFAGDYLPPEKRIPVDRWLSDTTLVVNMGLLHDVRVGTVLQLLDADSRKAVIKAIVTESMNVSSTATVTAAIDKKKTYYAEVEAYGTGGVQARVKMAPAAKGTEKAFATVQQLLKKQEFVELTDQADYMIVFTPKGSQTLIELIETGDAVRYTTLLDAGKTMTEAKQQELISQLKEGSRARFVRALPDGGPLYEFVKVGIRKAGESTFATDIQLMQGDDYDILITNNSNVRLFYSIINILPNNEVGVLVPEPDGVPQDYSLGAGESFPVELTADTAGKTGKEVLRIIFSTTPIDLRPSFDGNRKTVRSGGSAIEKLLDEAMGPGSKKILTRSTGNHEVTIASLGFSIGKK